MAHHIDQLKHIIDHSERIVFFTGAGVSVASGVPDFVQWVVCLMKFQKKATHRNIC